MPTLCSQCHAPLKDGAQFCSKCGAQVSGITASAIAQPAATASVKAQPAAPRTAVTTVPLGATTTVPLDSQRFPLSTPPPRQAEIRDDTRPHGWNWGAFFLSWIWLFAHNMKRQAVGYLALLLVTLSLFDRSATSQVLLGKLYGSLPVTTQHALMMPQNSMANGYVSNLVTAVILLAICIPIGLRGNDWVWQYGQSEDNVRFVGVQRQWATWGIIALLLTPLLCFAWSTIWMDSFHIVM